MSGLCFVAQEWGPGRTCPPGSPGLSCPLGLRPDRSAPPALQSMSSVLKGLFVCGVLALAFLGSSRVVTRRPRAGGSSVHSPGFSALSRGSQSDPEAEQTLQEDLGRQLRTQLSLALTTHLSHQFRLQDPLSVTCFVSSLPAWRPKKAQVVCSEDMLHGKSLARMTVLGMESQQHGGGGHSK